MIPISKARKVAGRIEQILAPHCTRFHIAGSVRRGKPQVKDIEIVCQPKKEFRQTDLFGNGDELFDKGFVQGLTLITERVVKGSIGGRYMQIILKGGVTLDLFLPVPEDYFRQLVIRTGSKEYVANVIAAGWLRLGWCGTTNMGLRRIQDCVKTPAGEGKTNWKCINQNAEAPPAWQSEEEFFAWLRIPFVGASLREYKPVLNYSL